MSAEVESMFSVREVPWHGLGTIVQEAPTSKDALSLAGLDWKVMGKPIYDTKRKQIPGYFANTRDSDGKVLGIVKGKYKIVQNTEAFEFTDNLISEGVTYETAGSLHGGKNIWLLAKLPTEKIIDDEVEPYICFTNSFDGTGSVRVCLTPVRVVCNNTLNLALSKAKRAWSTRHTGDIAGKLEEAKQALELSHKYMKELDSEAVRLAEKIVTDAALEDILDKVYPYDPLKDSNRKKENVEICRNNFYTAYNMPDIKAYKGTAWGVVNAIADVVDHAQPNRNTKGYWENQWGKIMLGRTDMDKVYALVS